MQLRGSGTGPGQATAWLQAAGRQTTPGPWGTQSSSLATGGLVIGPGTGSMSEANPYNALEGKLSIQQFSATQHEHIFNAMRQIITKMSSEIKLLFKVFTPHHPKRVRGHAPSSYKLSTQTCLLCCNSSAKVGQVWLPTHPAGFRMCLAQNRLSVRSL